jgi:hypothetical protein
LQETSATAMSNGAAAVNLIVINNLVLLAKIEKKSDMKKKNFLNQSDLTGFSYLCSCNLWQRLSGL